MALRGELTKILINRCTQGIYLRWWYNGWHYFLFSNGYEIEMSTESQGTQVTNFFSRISKIERATRIKTEYDYRVELHGITAANISGFMGLLLAEQVEQYENGVWREVYIRRGDHLIKPAGANGYIIEFEIWRYELPVSSSVYHKSLKLYIGDTLCDIDDDEIIPINKQVNDIAEMQDRQGDFTASFRIRKTRAMRTLFQLSGDPGANTVFPYQKQSCRLVQDNIEIITDGILILDKCDNEYYHVSILSGNINFFKSIETLKITDLVLPTMYHTWDVNFIESTHSDTTPVCDVVYPLCEPSDDGSIAPLNDDGDKVEMYGGWIWPFCKIKAIWDEIFANAGYIVTGGDILESDLFDRLFMPIASREVNDTTKYLYSSYMIAPVNALNNWKLGIDDFAGVILIKGDNNFHLGWYYAPYTATYKLKVVVYTLVAFNPPPELSVYLNGGYQGDMTTVEFDLTTYTLEYEIDASAGQHIVVLTNAYYYIAWFYSITEIKDALIDYGSIVDARLYLPEMTQINFIKMICNLLGLIPEVIPRDRKIRFWNYAELYENISIARDWTKYLSENDEETEFKFGDYGQNNYLRYRESDDVLKDGGTGILPVEDETLPEEKNMIELSVSTCDEVVILTNNFSVTVSRIAFNTWDAKESEYRGNEKIDPRIVYINYVREIASPAYTKSLWIRPTVLPLAGLFAAPAVEIVTPKKASSIEVSFSSLISYYANLSRMLTRTNVRKEKFNLPVYEVAGLRHNVPIYLSQYKAYFYVNKISNYIAGQLCEVELIKL